MTGSIPIPRRSLAGPIPERRSRAGVSIEPALRTTCPLTSRLSSEPSRTSVNELTWSSVKCNRDTRTSVHTVRLGLSGVARR